MIESREEKRRKIRMIKTIMLTLFLVCPLIFVVNVKSAMGILPVHNLNTGLNYATIQEAIDATETLEGHTIKADAGTYNENVVVYKNNLTIFGENPVTTVIDSQGVGEVIYITASHVKIRRFTIKNGWAGIYLAQTDGNIFEKNNITGNYGYGIFVDTSNSNVFISSNISQNTNGIFLWYSNNNTIYHNNFIDNIVQVSNTESNSTWDHGYPSGGNYWSNYTGVDANGDGIGDTPHVIDSYNKDKYPLIVPYPYLPGDINHDGKVNIFDLVALAKAYGSTPTTPNWNRNADTNNDKIIDVRDLRTLGKNYGKSSNP